MDEFSPNTFNDVFSAELEEIGKRQHQAAGTEPMGERADPKSLAGIALSGGGIRAATSALGVLQALRKMGMLPVFDYLSTVSGGGFAGGWWSAWTSRNFDASATKEETFFPPPERTQPERDRQTTVLESREAAAKKGTTRNEKTIDPVHHLRLFSNYLTPMKGMMSADTWRANTVISRNLVLTWLVLIPMLFAAVLLAQSYFTVQPRSETEFLYPYSHLEEDDLEAKNLAFEMSVIGSLDSVVHGRSGPMGLVPVQKLRQMNAPVQDDPYALMVGNIKKLRSVDSSVVAYFNYKKTAPILQMRLDTIEQRVVQWHLIDSSINADGTLTLQAREQKIAFIKPIFQKLLDPDVDSVRILVTRLQVKLLAHREATRDSWLFNDEHLGYLANRAIWTSVLPIMMISWIVMLICLWMINSGHRMFGGNVLQGCYAFIGGFAAFFMLNWVTAKIAGAVELGGTYMNDSLPLLLTWSGIALVLLSLILWDDTHWFWKKHRKAMTGELTEQLLKLLEVRRARIVTFHQRLLLGAFLSTVLLCFGGFGHEAINYLLFYHSGKSADALQWLARFGGIAVLLSALTGTGLAARTAATRSDRGDLKQPNKIKSFLITMAPPLILLLLLCGISWASHWVLQALVFRGGSSSDENYLQLVFVMWLLGFLSLYYAVFDLHFRARRSKHKKQAKQFSRLLLFAVILIQVAMMAAVLTYPSEKFRFDDLWWVALPIAIWSIIGWKYWWEQNNPRSAVSAMNNASEVSVDPDAASKPTEAGRPVSIGSRIRAIALATGSSLLILGFSALMWALYSIFKGAATLPIDHLFLVALGASVLILLLDLLWGIRAPEEGRRGNHESRLLLGINVTLFTLFLLIPPLAESPHWGVTHVLEVLLSLAIGLVVFIGWRIDPNALSIHEFYRNRLIRAYLGASNWLKGSAAASQAHPEDDIVMTQLANCDRGAPYHLVNTTLNLLGSKSLETAQRNASNFILSKRYCGSVTTGYRPTEDYMSNTMTLGTAVAISGAAASPNMGSNQVSGATTVLMSMLNVRLGYWAANPGRSRWREAQPKLWPYYLLKESLSQTSGYGAFCYLTDGGHFDNTGLYPLIERACRFIVVCDNGADPLAHFKDLGNALRRCRIDFGAEFSLDGLKEMTSLGGPSTDNTSDKAHWLRGTVTYSEEHLRTIWGDAWDEGLSAEERLHYKTGAIVVLKPVLLGDEPVDVLQYGLEYADFPQQSTANQWFSEGQFESYRRLGYWSAQTAFGSGDFRNASRVEQLQAIVGTPPAP